MKWLGAVTPFGGLCFIAGWICMVPGILRVNFSSTDNSSLHSNAAHYKIIILPFEITLHKNSAFEFSFCMEIF
jgi:hypothetical protein